MKPWFVVDDLNNYKSIEAGMEKINNPKMVSQLMDLREQFMSEKRALPESNYPPTPFPKGLDETMAEAARLINVCMRLGYSK